MKGLFLIVFLAALIPASGVPETITDPDQGSEPNRSAAVIDPLSLLMVSAIGRHIVAAEFESRLPSTQAWRISPSYVDINGAENVGLLGGILYLPPHGIPRPLFVEAAVGLSLSLGGNADSPPAASAWWGCSVLSVGVGPAAMCPRKAGLAIQFLNKGYDPPQQAR